MSESMQITGAFESCGVRQTFLTMFLLTNFGDFLGDIASQVFITEQLKDK